MARLVFNRPVVRSAAASVSGPQRLRRWAVAGGLLGALLGALSQAPAVWLARAVDDATGGRLQLIEARGTVWDGSALLMLTGGPGSRDASVLPSRLDWQLSLHLDGVQLALAQDCCVAPGLKLRLQPGWRDATLQVQPGDATGLLGQWPAAWLDGLGAPWNTLRPGGLLRLSSQNFSLTAGATGWQVQGQARIGLMQTSSRLSTLNPLGSYELSLVGQTAAPATLQLQTLEGALQLSGSGELRAKGGVRFRGEGRAQPGQEPALNNLLNIIGRRQGATSVITIG